MIDIHNEARVAWRNIDDATKAEIQRQHLAGAKVDFHYHPLKGWACVVHGVPIWAELSAYRIHPGTEILPASTRPADEMDLTKLCKPFGLLHAETQAAVREWPYGIRFLNYDGDWQNATQTEFTNKSHCYRAKPAPKLNLVERVSAYTSPSNKTPTQKALTAAHALIATMSGGDPELRKAYDEAIK